MPSFLLYTLGTHFNSIKVQLKLGYIHTQLGIRQFQFHKGTIKTKAVGRIVAQSNNFNSIKVQLKPRPTFEHDEHLIFQFHKGTIKTSRVGWMVAPCGISIP